MNPNDMRNAYEELLLQRSVGMQNAGLYSPHGLQNMAQFEHVCAIGHGYTVVWTSSDGNKSRIHACGFSTVEEMEKSRSESLAAWGWTPPKWWQWWRWDDTKLTS